MSQEEPITLKICLVGDFGVGKTSLRRKFMGQRFKKNYLPTVGADFSFKEIDIENVSYRILLWDLAGEEKFRNVRGLYFQGVNGCILVFDITQKSTFDNLLYWVEDIENSTLTKGVPIWIMGNKKDLLVLDEKPITDSEINIMMSNVREKFKDRFDIGFAMTSALTGENVASSIDQLVSNIMVWDNKLQK